MIGRFIDRLVFVMITIISFILGAASGWILVKGPAGLVKNLRNTMFEQLQDFAFENIEKSRLRTISKIRKKMDTEVCI